MKVLVTGGTGFVGSHLVELLLKKKYEVYCLVRDPSKLKHLEGQNVSLVTAVDIFDENKINLSEFSGVFHLAGVTKGINQKDYLDGNVKYTAMLTEALLKAGFKGKYIVVGSQSASGPSSPGKARKLNDPPIPQTWYALSKLEMEKIIEQKGESLNWTILRPPAIFGPRDTDMLESFKVAKKGLNPLINGIDKKISIIYVKDLARAILDTFEHQNDFKHRIYYVNNPDPISITGLNHLVSDYYGKKLRNIYVPAFIMKILGEIYEVINRFSKKPNIISRQKIKELLPPEWVCDASDYFNDIGYFPETPIVDAVRETIDWYEEHDWI